MRARLGRSEGSLVKVRWRPLRADHREALKQHAAPAQLQQKLGLLQGRLTVDQVRPEPSAGTRSSGYHIRPRSPNQHEAPAPIEEAQPPTAGQPSSPIGTLTIPKRYAAGLEIHRPGGALFQTEALKSPVFGIRQWPCQSGTCPPVSQRM